MSRVPRIRFKGFEEDWEQRKLGEIAIFNPKSKLPSTFEYVDLESVIGTEMVSHSTETISTAPSRAQRLAKKGDIFYQTVRPYQKNNYLFEKDERNYVFSTGYAQLRPSVNERFLFYLTQNGNFVNMVLYNCTGTSYPAINSSDMRRIDIYLSRNSTEQKCIGNTIKTIDHLITLHQRKLEKLKIIKKSMLENLFPQNGEKTPKIRFSEFTNDWEQRKWIDVVDISKNMVDPRNGKYDNLPHISPGNIESFTGQLYDNVKCVKDENLISGKFKFSSGDIIYGKINPQLGKYLYATFSGLTSADAYVLNAKNEVNQKYLYTIIQTRNFFEYSVSVSMRSGMPKINRDELNVYSFFAPATDEQLKIGNCILKYDHLITLHQSKLEKLQKIKKSMLESMFV